jgi:hypothetical protein
LANYRAVWAVFPRVGKVFSVISHNDLQSLINDIDKILPRASSHFARSKVGDVEVHYQLFEKIRNYLVFLQEQPQESAANLAIVAERPETATTIASKVLDAIDLHLEKWLVPFHTELEQLRGQKESLQSEVRDLELKRGQIITDLVKVFVEQCSDRLHQEIANTWKNLEQEFFDADNLEISDESTIARHQKLVQLQAESDRLLMALDSSFRTVFAILERDLQGYHRSLSRGLEKIDRLGEQGEIKLTEKIQRLHQLVDNSFVDRPVKGENIRSASDTIDNLADDVANLPEDLLEEMTREHLPTNGKERDLSLKAFEPNISEASQFIPQEFEQAIDSLLKEIKTENSHLTNFPPPIIEEVNFRHLAIEAAEDVHTIIEIPETSTIGELSEVDTEPQTNKDSSLVESEPVQKIESLSDLIEGTGKIQQIAIEKVWYLGIDVGTIGLSGVLLSAKFKNGALDSIDEFPLYWSAVSRQKEFKSSFYLSPKAYEEATWKQEDVSGKSPTEFQEVDETNSQTAIVLDDLKSYLNLAIPEYYQSDRQEPTSLVENERQLPSLSWLQQAIESLFSTLTPSSAQTVSGLRIGAIALSQEALQQALSSLKGIIVSCPAFDGENYRLNISKAILETQIVPTPSQIFFVEDSIASLLAKLPIEQLIDREHGDRHWAVPNAFSFSAESPEKMSVLIINSGATKTELALVDLPKDFKNLNRHDFIIRSFAYGGNDLDRDIFYQSIYPQWLSQLNQSLPNLDLDLPKPGEPDLQKRAYANLRLQNYPLGRSFIEAAKLVKLILQQQDEFSSFLGNKQWFVKRHDLDLNVIRPFVEHINQEIDILLGDTGKLERSIARIVCSGGTTLAIWRILSNWLQRKFPNAQLIHDGDENSGNKVASGLVRLSLFDNLLEQSVYQKKSE